MQGDAALNAQTHRRSDTENFGWNIRWDADAAGMSCFLLNLAKPTPLDGKAMLRHKWGTDYLNRAATAMSNILENRPEETKYFCSDLDSFGLQPRSSDTTKSSWRRAQPSPAP